MTHLFRQPDPSVESYAALALFAVAYLAAMGIILSPEALLRGGGGTASNTETR